ncbi:MAG: cupin domain-containing protein [Rhodospirillaceae bacterium]|nr:cupin domain-containing protein [Rhodospirillaceae bacterium]
MIKHNDSIPVGFQVRDLRKAKGLTIPQLAAKVGRSTGWLSQVERNISPVTIPNLKLISDALAVQITWFFQGNAVAAEDERDFIVRKDTRRQLRYTGTGVSEELLSPNLGRQIEMLMTTLEPGASTGEPYSRKGEEGGYVVSGVLELTVAGNTQTLATGDSFAFESHLPHTCHNPGDVPTAVVWVVTPPSY